MLDATTVYGRIQSRTKISPDEDPCFEYQGVLNHGYGIIGVNGQNIRTHRFMFEFHKGPIPEDKIVLHRCNNRKCWNPKHLFLGTHQDNSDHAKESGTTRHLDRRELTVDQVIAIKRLLQAGVRRYIIAQQFKVHAATIRYIDIGRTYQDIKVPLDELSTPSETPQ